MNNAQREAQKVLLDLVGRNQLFPPTDEEVGKAVNSLRPVLGPKTRGIRPRGDQVSIDDMIA